MIATNATSPEPVAVTSLDDYQDKAGSYQFSEVPPVERVFGLAEEVGEVMGVFKRMARGDFTDDPGPKLSKELGDVLWYLSRIAADNGWKLSDIAQGNLDKLESRRIRNVLMGSGDNR